MRADMSQQLCHDALTMALTSRRPGPGLLHHTTGEASMPATPTAPSCRPTAWSAAMSRTGDCWDNAVAESFFKTLKAELVDGTDFATHEYEASPRNPAMAA